jgi:hypothetical protein
MWPAEHFSLECGPPINSSLRPLPYDMIFMHTFSTFSVFVGGMCSFASIGKSFGTLCKSFTTRWLRNFRSFRMNPHQLWIRMVKRLSLNALSKKNFWSFTIDHYSSPSNVVRRYFLICTKYGPRANCGPRRFFIRPAKYNILLIYIVSFITSFVCVKTCKFWHLHMTFFDHGTWVVHPHGFLTC